MDKEDVVYIHTGEYYSAIKNEILEFPGGPLVKNLPASARYTGLIPGLGRFHTAWDNWAHAPRLESSPHSPQLEKAHT